MNLILIFCLTALLHSTNAFSLCGVCQCTFSAIVYLANLMTPNFAAVELLEAICMRKYDSEKLCQKVGEEIAPLAVQNLIKNHLNPEKICSTFCNNSFVYYNIDQQIDRILHNRVTEPMNIDSYMTINEHKIQNKASINILQLSDVHIDHDYTENASIYCEYPICCHQEHGFPENPSARAQKFGSKNCDSPPELFLSFLSFVKQKEKIDIILLTGDISAHNEWQKTFQLIKTSNTYIQKILADTFPSSILIKSQGNNDYAPDHQFDPSSNNKLLQVTHVVVGENKTKLTFVAINSIVCDQMNLYALGEQGFMVIQLRLLEKVLEDPENKNIYLVAHIPITLSQTISNYAKILRTLITKYSKKIRSQFYGHIHSDQIALNTIPKTQKITSFAFICPSLSPLYIGSSKARVYSIETETGGVVDYNQYILDDLQSMVPRWRMQYRFREQFQIQGSGRLGLEDFEEIKKKVFSDEKYQNMYLRLSGIVEVRGQKIYCNMLDDILLRKACYNKSESITDKIINFLTILRGSWGYRKSLVS